MAMEKSALLRLVHILFSVAVFVTLALTITFTLLEKQSAEVRSYGLSSQLFLSFSLSSLKRTCAKHPWAECAKVHEQMYDSSVKRS